MTETEEVIKILDILADHRDGQYTSGRYEWEPGVFQWYLAEPGIDIKFDGHEFRILHYLPRLHKSISNGFDLLELLAGESSYIAAKLAEPME